MVDIETALLYTHTHKTYLGDKANDQYYFIEIIKTTSPAS
jgi:hypothetical protein